jgi:hypothetical protein
MSNVLEIQDKLRENTELIAQLEKSLAVHQSKAVAASLRSLYKINHVYQEEFRAAAEIDLVDVVSYRIFDGSERPTMALVGKALDYFQSLYTVLYVAASTGKPRDTAHLSVDAINSTAFEFAYSYSGSLGFVFTLPNERLLFGETYLDEAMHHLFVIAKADSVDEIKALARRFGLAPIRAIYKWLSTLSGSGVGIGIDWKKNDNAKEGIVLQPAEIEALRKIIDSTSDLEIDENQLTGRLVAFDTKSRTFKLELLDESATLRGSIADSADIPGAVVIPDKYTAIIKTKTRVRYATEQPEVSHELLSLSQ